MSQILNFLGYDQKLVLLSDSSAARGMANRQGSGKVKHLSMKHLWIQQAVREKQLEVEVVDTAFNWSDIGTKALDAPRLQSLVSRDFVQHSRSRCAAD